MLKQDGKIRHYGVSNFSPAMMDGCESAGHLAANQVGYHLFDRRVERAALPYTRSRGIGFMAYGTPGLGLLTGAFNECTTFVEWHRSVAKVTKRCVEAMRAVVSSGTPA